MTWYDIRKIFKFENIKTKNACFQRRYQTALFWAEKVTVMSDYDPNDIYWQAQCLFLLKEYHRAAHVIQFHELEKTNINCYYLAIESLFEAKEFNEALGVMNCIEVEDLGTNLLNSQTAADITIPHDQNKNVCCRSILHNNSGFCILSL